MDGVKIREYRNGFELRYMKLPLHNIMGSLVVNVGAGYELPHEFGVSHFVEHTVLRGGTSKISPEEAKIICSLLGYSNAFTSVSKTSYDGKFLPEDLDTYLHFASDITLDAQFNPKVVEEERNGILAERGGYANDPANLIGEAVHNAMYSVSPFRRGSRLTLIGPEENIGRFTQEALKQYHRKWTNRANMTLYLMGPLPDDIEDKVDGYFGQEDAPFEQFRYEKEQGFAGAKREGITRKDAKRTTVVMAWYAPPKEQHDLFLRVDFMKDMLTGDFTSGLLRELRVKRGLIYGISSGYASEFGEGLFLVGTDVEPGKESEIEGAVIDYIGEFQRGDIDKAFFERQKRRGRFFYGNFLDDPERLFSMIRKEKETGVGPERILRMVEGFQLNDVEEAAKHIERDRYLFFTESP